MAHEEYAREILGNVLFDQCFSFFKEVFCRKSEFKIILTRRCFSLFKIFAPILEAHGIRNSEKTTIITDNAIDANIEEIKMTLKRQNVSGIASVLIVDDIIVYGRTIHAILDRILDDSDSTKNNLRIMCIVNSVQNHLNEKYSDLILTRYTASSVGWKEYSYIFSKLIKAFDVANTSYIVSAVLPKEKVDESFIDFCNKDMLCTTPQELKRNSVESYVISADLTDSALGMLKIQQKLCGFIRMYTYEKLGTVVISPLLILNNLSTNEMGDMLLVFAESFCKDAKILNSLLINKDESLGQYKMRMFTLLLSHLMLRDFMTTRNIPFDCNDTDFNEIIRYNFSISLLEDFKKFDSACSCFINNSSDRYFNYTSEGISSEYEELEKLLFDKAMADNDAVKKDQSCRQQGFNTLDKKPLFVKKFIAGIMVLLDNGLAALKVEYHPSKEYCVSSLVYPGEQALRAMSDKWKSLLPSLYALENFSKMYNLNCYEQYQKFSELVYKKGMHQGDFEKFKSYLDILERNHQQISDVMCIDYTKDLETEIEAILDMLNEFEKEVLKK